MSGRIDWVERMLVEWATHCTVGDGSGYPTMSVLHPNWSPPSGRRSGSVKPVTSSTMALAVHRALQQLSETLRATLAVHYCLRLPMLDQAQRLGCSERTVHDRVARAHQLLAQSLPSPGRR